MSDLLLYGVSSKDLGTLVEKVVKILVEKGLISKENPKLKAKSFRSTYDLDIKYKADFGVILDFPTLLRSAINLELIDQDEDNQGLDFSKILQKSPFSKDQTERAGVLNGIDSGQKQKLVHPYSLHYLCTQFQDGFDRDLVSKTLSHYQPLVCYCLDATGVDNYSSKELRFTGYQIYRVNSQKINSANLIYVNKLCDASYLKEYFREDQDDIWLKLYHPDNLSTDPSSESTDTYRPITIVGCIRCDSVKKFSSKVAYVNECVQKVLAGFPTANILILGDVPGEQTSKEGIDPRLKSFLVQTPGTKFIAFTKCSRTELNLGWQRPLHGDYAAQIICMLRNPRYFCPCCDVGFGKEDGLLAHRKTYRHKKNFQGFVFQRNKESTNAKGYNLKVFVEINNAVTETSSSTAMLWKIPVGSPQSLKILLKNCDDPVQQQVALGGKRVGIVVQHVDLIKEESGIKLEDKYGVAMPEKRKGNLRLVNGQTYPITVVASKLELGHYHVPIFVSFSKDGCSEIAYIIRELIIQVGNEDSDFLAPVSEYVRTLKVKPLQWNTDKAVPGLQIDPHTSDKPFFFASKKLGNYNLKPDLVKLLNNGFTQFVGMDSALEKLLTSYNSLLETELSSKNYSDRFSLLLSCEEHQMQLDIRSFDMSHISMKEHGTSLLSLENAGLAENRPSVLRGDKIYARVFGLHQPDTREFEGIVHDVQNTVILVGFSPELRSKFNPFLKFDVRFTFNRHPLRNMYRAIDMIGEESKLDSSSFWWSLLFPDESSVKQYSFQSYPIKSYFNSKVESNQEQKMAVENIVNGGIAGIPYIVFGPPGTGKTVTIVEAIKQVWRCQTNSKILAAAPSNAAADVLALRLLDHIPKSQLIRIYAPSRDFNEVPDYLKLASNFVNHANTIEAMEQYRVVIVTMVTAGRFVEFPSCYFSHFFIDEAGHSTEPECLIALAGLYGVGNISQVVLAGDPKQLGPILRSPLAIKHGLQISMMERLMNRPVYQKDPATGLYNNRCITKLLCNFRCHQKLLELPSEMFYESELISKANLSVTSSLLKCSCLPQKDFPMVFHGVVGEDKREAESPSYFNQIEAVVIVDYVEKLLQHKPKVHPHEIGVISPYRRQVQKIRDLLGKRLGQTVIDWRDITVGSTEEFQGQERRVILISTVRSQPEFLETDLVHRLGFLRNPKRFNVAITRCKALLVIVGNPFLLWMDKCWRLLITYAQKNGGYTGATFNPESSSELQKIDEKFRQMGLPCFSDDDDLEFIRDQLSTFSLAEEIEGQVWTADSG